MLMPDRPGRALVSPSRDRPPAASRRDATVAVSISTAAASASAAAASASTAAASASTAAASTSGEAASTSTTTISQAPAVVPGVPVIGGGAPDMGAGAVRSGWTALVASALWLLFLPIRCLSWIWPLGFGVSGGNSSSWRNRLGIRHAAKLSGLALDCVDHRPRGGQVEHRRVFIQVSSL